MSNAYIQGGGGSSGGGSSGSVVNSVFFSECQEEEAEETWTINSTVDFEPSGETGRVGIISLAGGGADGGIKTKDGLLRLGTAELTLRAEIRMTDASVSGGLEVMSCGITNATGGYSSVSAGCYFRITNASANWECVTEASSTETTSDSGVAVTTDWIELKVIVNAAADSVEFYIDDSLVATHTTNIPATTVDLTISTLAGNLNENVLCDVYSLEQVRP